MPDGERVTTGSEPRRFTLARMAFPMEHGPHARRIKYGDEQLQPGEEIEVVEVESGHDEQTDPCPMCGAESEWKPHEGSGAVIAGVKLDERWCTDCGYVEVVKMPDTVSREHHLRVVDALLVERDAARERTVAAVVEALRNYGRRKVNGEFIDPPHPPTTPVVSLADFIEERFEPSAPGGGNA